MNEAISDAARSAVKSLLRTAGLRVRIVRGSVSREVSLAPTRPQEEASKTLSENRRDHTDKDWIGLAASYVLGSRPVAPERGDRIIQMDGPDRVTYEVIGTANTRPYQYLDAAGVGLRIHTRLIETTTL